MNDHRARAYARVTKIVNELGAIKLLPAEAARIRHAADTLLFCADLSHDRAARSEFSEVDVLREHLVSSGRWSEERASALVDDLWACGPGLLAALPAAA
jgi:hypothetical protein